MSENESEFVQKEPCPECGSRDNLARYSDGHAHCFGCEYYEPPDGETKVQRKSKPMSSDLLSGEVVAIANRKIPEEICRKYDYRAGKNSQGQWVHIANYRDQSGTVVSQHLRTKDKDFPWINKQKDLQLFGFHLVRDEVSKLIITEGEIDAMSVSAAIGPKSRWGSVSIGGGAKAAEKDIAANLTRIEKAEEIILMFDMDDIGREAAQRVARMFRPGKCKIARLPEGYKDANELWMAGKGAEIVDAIFSAQEWRPEGVVQLGDIREDIMTDPVRGFPWFHPGLDDAVLGRRLGELDALGAGTGVGKTDLLTQQIEYDINTLKLKVGLFFLEQLPRETARRIAGKAAGRKFHIPPSDENPWTSDELVAEVDRLEQSECLYMYDHFGSAEYDLIEDTIRFLYHSAGVQIFYLDHLTALAAQADDERKALEEIMARLGGLVKELDIWICIVSHLATPDMGKSHEEGGRVTIRQFKGSRSIGFWCHHMFGLERNQQAEDEEERQTTRFRVLKDRVTGQATGKVFEMGYDHSSGRLYPQEQTDAFPPVEGGAIF